MIFLKSLITILIIGSCTCATTISSIEVVKDSSVEIETTTGPGADNLRVYDDIEFDIDNDTNYSQEEKDKIKSGVLYQFRNPTKDPQDIPTCFCPRIYGPVVCDNEGSAHNNICNFNCAQYRSSYALMPRKVLIKVKMGDEKDACMLPSSSSSSSPSSVPAEVEAPKPKES